MEAQGDFAEYLEALDTIRDAYLIKVPFQGGLIAETLCYVIRDGDRWLLIDAGARSSLGRSTLMGALKFLGVELPKLSVFVTHLHFDHSGLIEAIAGSCERIYLSRIEYVFATASVQRNYEKGLLVRALSEGMNEEQARTLVGLRRAAPGLNAPEEKICLLDDSDEIVLGSRRLKAIWLPGHTIGHMGLIDEASSILFSGDHVLPDISPSIDFFPCAMDGYRFYTQSLRNVLDLSPSCLFYAHGTLGCDERERIAWLLRHHEERCEVCVSYIASRDHPPTGMEAICNMPWNVPGSSWEDIPAIQRAIISGQGFAILDHLRYSRRIARTIDESGLFRYSLFPGVKEDDE